MEADRMSVRIPTDLQLWIDARKRFHLSHKQVQMARELGMNPKRFGSLANHNQNPENCRFLLHRVSISGAEKCQKRFCPSKNGRDRLQKQARQRRERSRRCGGGKRMRPTMNPFVGLSDRLARNAVRSILHLFDRKTGALVS
jgi:hypothetical protein